MNYLIVVFRLTHTTDVQVKQGLLLKDRYIEWRYDTTMTLGDKHAIFPPASSWLEGPLPCSARANLSTATIAIASCSHRAMDPWIHGAMVPSIHGVMEPNIHGAMEPWLHGTRARGAEHGATEPKNHRAMEPLSHGTMEPFNH